MVFLFTMRSATNKFTKFKSTIMRLVTTAVLFIASLVSFSQDVIYREHVYLNQTENTEGVFSMFKVRVEMTPNLDVDALFSSGRDIHFMDLKEGSGKSFFDITEYGVYGFSFLPDGQEYNNPIITYVVLDEEYLIRMRERGLAKQIDGVLSSRGAPLELNLEETTYYTSSEI